jgi:hypothetical protein
LGQPYFLDPLQEAIIASAIIATIGAIRRILEISGIRFKIMNSKKLV